MDERETQPEVVTETPAPETESYNQPSIHDMLAGRSEAEPEPAVEPEPTPEPAPGLESVAASPDAPADPQAVTPATPPVPPAAPAVTPEIQALIDARIAEATKGLVGALQGERSKRQAYEQQLGAAIPVDEAQAQVAQLKNQFLEMSELMARQTYKDYDEVTSYFYQEAAANEALRDSVLSAKAPAMAAYQAGLNVKLAKEFGADVVGNPYLLMQKTKEKHREELRAELAKEFEAKLQAKSHERKQTPTDISQARAAGGGSQPYVSPSLSDMLKMANKR